MRYNKYLNKYNLFENKEEIFKKLKTCLKTCILFQRARVSNPQKYSTLQRKWYNKITLVRGPDSNLVVTLVKETNKYCDEIDADSQTFS